MQALLECPAASAGLLERLDLADNTLGEEGGKVLAEALASQPSLTYVNLSECDLGVSLHELVIEVLVSFKGCWRRKEGDLCEVFTSSAVSDLCVSCVCIRLDQGGRSLPRHSMAGVGKCMASLPLLVCVLHPPCRNGRGYSCRDSE